MVLRRFPVFGLVDVFLLLFGVPEREAKAVVVEAEGGVVVLCHANVGCYFGGDLLERAVDVRVIHREHAHAQQPAERSRELVAVDGAVFGDAQWQLAVAALAMAEDQVVHGAVHRLQVVGAVVHLHRRIHRVGVVRQVAARLEELLFAEDRCRDADVAVRLLGLDRIALDFALEHLAVWEPDRQPLAEQLVNHVELHLAADFAVVALRRFLELALAGPEAILRRVAEAVDAHQRLAFAVGAPVGLAGAGELEPAQVRRAGNVRAAT